jgi:hypothetical protein
VTCPTWEVPESPRTSKAESWYLLEGDAAGSQVGDQEVSWEVPGADSGASGPLRMEVPMSVQSAEMIPIALSVAEVLICSGAVPTPCVA